MHTPCFKLLSESHKLQKFKFGLKKNCQILNNQFRCQNKVWVKILESINKFSQSYLSYLIYSKKKKTAISSYLAKPYDKILFQ